MDKIVFEESQQSGERYITKQGACAVTIVYQDIKDDGSTDGKLLNLGCSWDCRESPGGLWWEPHCGRCGHA